MKRTQFMAVQNDSRPILIIDDDPLTRELIAAAVKSLAYRYEVADSGKEALQKLETGTFCLILLDLLMPGMDGFEAVRGLRNRGVQTPVIALSALSMKQDRERALAMGCTAFVPKPVEIQQLRDIITTFAQASNGTGSGTPANAVHGRTEKDSAGKRMLLIECDKHHARAYASAMAEFGFQVTVFDTSDRALSLLDADADCTDIIMINLHTSGIDALGMLAIMRRRFPHVMVAIHTDQYDHDIYQLAMQQGADTIFPATLIGRTAAGMIETAMIKRQRIAAGVSREHHQKKHASYGCDPPCDECRLFVASREDTGGHIFRCRKFNNADRCGFVLADVQGNNLAGIYLADVFLGILNTCWPHCQYPGKLLQVINNELRKLGNIQSHICVTAMLWDGMRRIVHLATAGTPGALLYTREPEGGCTLREIAGGGMCLGLLDEARLVVMAQANCTEPGWLFLFSSGIDKNVIHGAIAAASDLLADQNCTAAGQSIMQTADRGQNHSALLAMRLSAADTNRYPCYWFPSNYDEVDRACRWAAGALVKGVLPVGKDPDLVLLALREALLNAVEHGNGRNPECYVYLQIRLDEKNLVIDVCDEGCGFDMRQCMAGQISHDQIGKRGLPAMHQIADCIAVDGGTVSLIFKKH